VTLVVDGAVAVITTSFSGTLRGDAQSSCQVVGLLHPALWRVGSGSWSAGCFLVPDLVCALELVEVS
jgi:hypothetical protein